VAALFGHDTAPGIAVKALRACPDALLLVLLADHAILNEAARNSQKASIGFQRPENPEAPRELGLSA
jgi:mannose-1-phosphate guanylyltransferase